MKKLVLCILFCWAFCSNTYAQSENIGTDSLPVFAIQDRELADVFDDFIDRAKDIDRTGTIFGVSFGLFDEGHPKGEMYVYMYVVRPAEPYPQDSLTLYRPHEFNWGFIQHRDILFRAQFHSYATEFNYYMLTDRLKKLPKKQKVCMKLPPQGYYDSRPAYEYNDRRLDCLYSYDGEKWVYGIKAMIIRERFDVDDFDIIYDPIQFEIIYDSVPLQENTD